MSTQLVSRPWEREDNFYITDERSKNFCSYLYRSGSQGLTYCNKVVSHVGHWGPRCEKHRDLRWSDKIEAQQQKARTRWHGGGV